MCTKTQVAGNLSAFTYRHWLFTDAERAFERASYYKLPSKRGRSTRAGLNHTSQPYDELQPSLGQQKSRFSRALAVIREAIRQHAFPGAALAVTHRGSLVVSQGFGRFTYEPDSPKVQPDSVFDLASVTKVVATTAMAMILHERGVLDLESPVAAILPEFVSLAPDSQQAARGNVTIRMLLAHSSGLPAYVKLFEIAHTRDHLIHAALATQLASPPGSKADYSDIGFIVLGEALSKLAGAPLDVFAEKEVFAPLRIARTCFNPPADWKSAISPTEDDHTFRSRVIQGEVNDENASVMRGVAGHAGLFAPAIDVARFAECVLRGGAPILRPATIGLFTRREPTPVGTSRALGWDTPSPPSSSGAHFSPHSFGHLGYTGTSLWIDPDRRLSVTLLTNRTWPDRSSQAIRQIRPLVHDAVVEAL
jgi:CubicO group peptidase (beta-lactamase class C family)